MAKINSLNDGQFDAVYTRGCSILVSAPAGSGKTKILVNRIQTLLEDDGMHVDQLLVLTFTNAAALEMKQRLEASIDARLQEDIVPSLKEHLLLQKQKLPTAYITNFHGFCSTLLKQYGYLIGLHSKFEICSDPSLLQHHILDICIARWIQDPAFDEFVSCYFAEYHFDNFKNMLFKFANLKNTIYDFNQYIKTMKATIYDSIILGTSFDDCSLADLIKEELILQAIEGKNKVIELKNYCSKHGLSFFYQNPYSEGKKANMKAPFDCYIKYFYDLLESLQNDSLATIIEKGKPVLEKSYTVSWDDDTRPYQKEYNAKKTAIIKHVTSKFDDLLYNDFKEFQMIMDVSYKAIAYMITLLKEYDQAYREYKQAHTILDFNDLESYTLTLLEPKYGIVDDLYHQLKEIMIDEYQDTNQIQETLIMKIANYKEPAIPCFMVGDMKQSIYRFREADPQIFNEKYLSYAIDDENAKTRRIDLKFNYRSNKIVLDSVNYIFNQIMDQEIGGLDYYLDDSAKLNYDYLRKEGATDTSQIEEITKKANERLDKENRFTTEVLLTNSARQASRTASEYEAMMVAKRIRELVDHQILDDYSGNPRKTEYKDIVVLMRSTTEFITFKKVFDRYHIPNNVVLSQGFLTANEIISSIYVLKAIDNHLDDIAFTSLLKGPYTMSHFDENFLAKIRQDHTLSMYENAVKYIVEQKDNYQAVEHFMQYYDDLVLFSKAHTAKQTLEKFYQDSEYPLFIASLINGKQRVANIELLLEKLGEQTNQTFHSVIHDFVQKMEHDVNMSPGQVLSTSDNAVSFMTIHKSKGLEFPIVFVCQMHKQFNKQDSRERLISDKNLGIALKPRVVKDLKEYHKVTIEYENKYRKLIASRQTKETINEEMRIFYVALTRASQKLICTGVISNPNVFIHWQEALINNEDDEMVNPRCQDHVLLYRNIRNANSYLDWLGLTLMRHPDFIKIGKTKTLSKDIEDDILDSIKQNSDTLAIYNNPNASFSNTKHAKFDVQFISTNTIEQYTIDVDTHTKEMHVQEYDRYNHYDYPYVNNLEKSIAVTRLIDDGDRHFVRMDYEEENTDFSASDRGTIIHSFMEHFPLQKNIHFHDTFTALLTSNLYDEKQRELLLSYKEKIQAFVNSDIYTFMVESKKVYKEKAFSLLNDNQQIIHGVFDVICINEDTITILDYKTDRIAKETNDDILKALHLSQMKYYIKVIRTLYPSYKVEAIVYYLHIHRYVSIS